MSTNKRGLAGTASTYSNGNPQEPEPMHQNNAELSSLRQRLVDAIEVGEGKRDDQALRDNPYPYRVGYMKSACMAALENFDALFPEIKP